jgi:uncharacterized delta-60 repeat protein
MHKRLATVTARLAREARAAQMWRTLGRFVCAAVLVALASPASGQAGTGVPDPTFGSGGIAKFELGIGDYSPASSFNALGFGPGGSIYAAGTSLDGGGTFEMLTARLTEGGALDPSFAGSGWVHNLPVDQGNVLFDEYVRALSAEASGVVVGGNAIERFTGAGQFDNGFAPNQPPVEIEALTRLADGDLLESGHRSTGETRAPAAAENIHADGAPDAGFGEGGLAIVPLHVGQYSSMTAHSAVQLADGDLLVAGAGYYALMGNEPEHPFLWLARLTPSGAIDTSYGEGGVRYIQGYGNSAFIEPRSGGLALLGTTLSGEGELITAWGLDAAGQPDASFGTEGMTVVPAPPGYDTTSLSAAAGDTHGRLLAVGEEDNTSDLTVHAPARPVLVRLEASGRLDSSFGEAGFLLGLTEADYKTIAVDGAGRILVGGSIGEKVGESGGHTYSLVERFVESLAPGVPPGSAGGADTWNQSANTPTLAGSDRPAVESCDLAAGLSRERARAAQAAWVRTAAADQRGRRDARHLVRNARGRHARGSFKARRDCARPREAVALGRRRLEAAPHARRARTAAPRATLDRGEHRRGVQPGQTAADPRERSRGVALSINPARSSGRCSRPVQAHGPQARSASIFTVFPLGV